MSSETPSRRRCQGFTILEMMVVVAIIILVAVMGYPAIQQLGHRGKLLGTMEQTAVHLRAARQEAVKLGVPVVAVGDFDANQFLIFANVDKDAGFQFQPDDSKPYGSADYVVAQLPLPSTAEIYFWGPGDKDPEGGDAIDGFTATPSGTRVAVFNPNGSVEATGAFRVADTRSNFFELRVAPRGTAKVEIKKYHFDPPWGGKAGFFPRGRYEPTGDPMWQWY